MTFTSTIPVPSLEAECPCGGRLRLLPVYPDPESEDRRQRTAHAAFLAAHQGCLKPATPPAARTGEGA